VRVLSHLGIPRLVVELDAGRVAELQRQKVPTLYGDAANSEILTHAHLEQARMVVVTLPDESAAEIVVATVRDMVPHMSIIVRATTQEGVRRLFELGADAVIHPELEGGLEIMKETLIRLDYPESGIQQYADAIRHGHDGPSTFAEAEQQVCSQMETPRT